MHHRILKIVAVKVVGRHSLWLRFDDGVERTIDFSEALAGETYAPLLDPAFFARVRLDSGTHTIVWPNGADFDPQTLHDWPRVDANWNASAQTWKAAPEENAEVERSSPVCHNLDSLAGTWTLDEAEAFDRAVADFGKVDEDLWK